MEHNIRLAVPDDCRDILWIYSYYVENTAVSFETSAPSPDDFRGRIIDISAVYPYLVYAIDGKIAGYAYASKDRERAAYQYNAGVSVYIDQKYYGKGIGGRLYRCLLHILYEQGFYNAYAGITLPNKKSVGLHSKFGFDVVGIFHKTGYKLGKWHDVIHMEKTIRPYDDHPTPIIPIDELSDILLSDIFISAFEE